MTTEKGFRFIFFRYANLRVEIGEDRAYLIAFSLMFKKFRKDILMFTSKTNDKDQRLILLQYFHLY